MTQTYTTDPYAGTGKTADAVMDDVNENFAALKSAFSGISAPGTPVGGQPWHDATARKVRNYANDAWLASLLGDADQKMPVYRNDTCEGWLIDDTVTDRVIALKGGSEAYNVDGGVDAGTWDLSHVHQWYNYRSGAHDQTYDEDGNAVNLTYNLSEGTYYALTHRYLTNGKMVADCFTNPGLSMSALRIAAAVCTLQYPDLS